MLLVSWNGTVCYNGEQYEEIGAFNEKSATIKIKQPIKIGDKLEFRTVALANTASVILALGDAIDNYPVVINNTNIGRTVVERFSDIVNVKDFGAKGDGITDDTEAIQAMITACGYALFLSGTYLCGNEAEFDAPMTFMPGAALTVASGDSIFIRRQVLSPKQWIFKGDGSYLMRNSSAFGEDARTIHVSWFGVFPGPDEYANHTARIKKACYSLGNFREGIIEFDTGSYYLTETVHVQRATWIKGAGTRRTVFRTDTDGWPMFQTDEQGCRFTGIQQELISPLTKREYPFISLDHTKCEAWDISSTNSPAVEINGSGCDVKDISSVATTQMNAGSAVVKCFGQYCTIDNVSMKTSAQFSYESIIRVDSSKGNAGPVTINNVMHFSRCRSVTLHCENNNLGSVFISNVISDIFPSVLIESEDTIDAAIKIENNSSKIISSILINNVRTGGYIDHVIDIEQTGTGRTQDIAVNNIIANGNSDIKLNRTNGTLANLSFGDSINLLKATSPFNISGAITKLVISPSAFGNALTPCSYDYSIADDKVAVIDLYRSVFTGFVMLSVGYQNYGIFVIRSASSNSTFTTIQASSNIVTANSALSGTTGTDGKFTIGVQNGKIYLENRLGSEQRVSCTLLTGIY